MRASIVVVALLCACSSSPPAPRLDGRAPDGRPPGADAAPDLAGPDRARPDTAKPKPDLYLGDGGPSALQAVVNSITLPKSDTEYAHDYDGSGNKNRLGAIIQVVASMGLSGMSFQPSIDNMISKGLFLMLMDVSAQSLVNDPAAKLRGLLGQDLDTPANPADNFSGSEPFGIKPGTPQNLYLAGSISSGKLTAGPGVLMAPVPIGPNPTIVSLERAEVAADVSSSPLVAMTSGRVYGVIPWTDVDQKLIPDLAAQMTHVYQDPGTSQAMKDIVKSLFDTNKDGTISADELRQNGLLSLVLAPDVDTDKDGKADGMSAGMAFTAVKCVIQ